MGLFESAAPAVPDSPNTGASGQKSSYQISIPFSSLRAPPLTRQTWSTPAGHGSGRKVVHLPSPLFYYVTNHSPGEGMAPDELMHQKGWSDLKEIFTSILTGRAKGLRICQGLRRQLLCWMGGESPELAGEGGGGGGRSSNPE